MQTFSFDPVELPAEIPALRAEIRAFLDMELADTPASRRLNSWAVFDAEFSRKLAKKGWIGMIWPRQYGGHEQSSIARYVLLEELLAAGAPVGAHWIADRQSGPALLKFGSEQQRSKYLPGMAAGETYCCIGMSEPNSGSDLASVRTKAEKLTDGRWKINGQKIWTTQAHRCQLMIALVRTAPADSNNRQAGLSQFLLELDTPGIEIKKIVDLVGGSHFAEVFFNDVIVDADCILGMEGQGWLQVTSELSLERSGPERYMSSMALYLEYLRLLGNSSSDTAQQAVGRIAAELWTLRQMSLSSAGQLAKGSDPAIEAAIVKDLGNSFEQMIPRLLQGIDHTGLTLQDQSEFSRCLGLLLQTAPSFSLRGGTREILRGIIARGLGLR
jgi:alkylation response protein AidB-like acyl-CoA dehydrogenase